MPVEYKDGNVLEAARARVEAIFDDFERVVVSVSAGKDSTVIRDLCIAEAERRGRRVALFFLDQEAEYRSTVDLMREWMADPRIEPLWYQVPVRMTNATSHVDEWLYAWGPGEDWIRPKEPASIHRIGEIYPQRFYDFFGWVESRAVVSTAYVVGLRSKESFHRFRAVTKRPGHGDWAWSTRTANPRAVRVYPIYDWTFGDVWKYIADEGLAYNRHYDRMYAKYGANAKLMRVSNLVHEKSFRCLADLHEFEPETYERLLRRVGGIHTAALYAREPWIYAAKSLPAAFETWRAFRDHVLETTPSARRERYEARFAKQSDDEHTAREQVRQLLMNDWENSVPTSSPRGANAAKIRRLYWDRL